LSCICIALNGSFPINFPLNSNNSILNNLSYKLIKLYQTVLTSSHYLYLDFTLKKVFNDRYSCLIFLILLNQWVLMLTKYVNNLFVLIAMVELWITWFIYQIVLFIIFIHMLIRKCFHWICVRKFGQKNLHRITFFLQNKHIWENYCLTHTFFKHIWF